MYVRAAQRARFRVSSGPPDAGGDLDGGDAGGGDADGGDADGATQMQMAASAQLQESSSTRPEEATGDDIT